MSDLESDILALKSLLEPGAPYFAGVIPLDAKSSKVFYESGDEYRAISFPQCSSVELKALTDACEPATFGLNHEDVLDETYRKAWKMDAEKFAAQLSLEGPMYQALSDMFVKNVGDEVSAELYKLNVYEPGSFFKSHVDTPRSTKMVGSLVIILPTDHEGGSLVFRHHGREWTFDSAEAVSVETASPNAASVAFYSDVEHEVLPVRSGYRVTLTYNIYVDKAVGPPSAAISASESFNTQVQNAIEAILSSKSCPLEEGDMIGFGLKHKYPFERQEYSSLTPFAASLKGPDAVLYHILLKMNLKPTVMVNYKDDNYNAACFTPGFIPFDCIDKVEGWFADWLLREIKGTIVAYDVLKGWSNWDERHRRILWLSAPTEINSFQATYTAYGNKPSQQQTYGNVCIVAEFTKPTSK